MAEIGGFDEFVVSLGYKGELIKDYFLRLFHLGNDLSVNLWDGAVSVHDRSRAKWKVHLVETGRNTMSGGRLRCLQPWLGNDTLMAPYGDGVANVNIAGLVDFHRQQRRLETVTAVGPPARFGGIQFDDGVVTDFSEKPQTSEGWINGGFFVLKPGVCEYLAGAATTFERDPLESLMRERQLFVYCHENLWQCMYTLRDLRTLNGLWDTGAPWKI